MDSVIYVLSTPIYLKTPTLKENFRTSYPVADNFTNIPLSDTK